jgi:elongation factor G
VPSDSTASVNGVISSRRGKILGFDTREGWPGWDTVSAQIPQSELHDLIVELRSLTQGVGTYEQKFDHLAELSGKLAETVVTAKKAAE